jgi:hypothetical protein
VAFVGVGKADVGRLNKQADTLGVCRDDKGGCFRLVPQKPLNLRTQENGFISGAIGQANTALISLADQTDGFQNHLFGEVAVERNTMPKGEEVLIHLHT